MDCHWGQVVPVFHFKEGGGIGSISVPGVGSTGSGGAVWTYLLASGAARADKVLSGNETGFSVE